MHLTMFRGQARRLGPLGNRAVALVEFAFVAPVVAMFLAAASDYGMAMWSRSCLANAVAQGSYYAVRTIATGTTLTAANIVTLVQGASSLTGVTATATDPTKCYCPTGVPASLSAAVACTTTCTPVTCTPACTDSTSPGNYLTITAKYTLSGIFTLKGITMKGDQITDSITVRLK